MDIPDLILNPGVRLHYRVDDFTHPWSRAETVLLLHGNAESGEAWYRWIPELGRDFAVLRPDLRGFGRSTPMPRDHQWSLDELAGDLERLLQALSLDAVHVVGAKLGGTLALHLAATRPHLVRTLTVIGAPLSGNQLLAIGSPLDEIARFGVGHWAARTMGARLGSGLPADAHDWWTGLMGRTPLETQLGFIGCLGSFDVGPLLPRIACPALVVASSAETIVGSRDFVAGWQRRIPQSEIAVVESDSYHIAASEADATAALVRGFLLRALQAGP